MITLQNITLRNFLSIGQVTQAVDFDKKDFIDGLEFGGAATFMNFAGESDVSLFI